MYRCTRCGEHVDAEDRERHSATTTHQDNGGAAEVVDEDYEEPPPTRGLSKTR